MTAPPTWCVSSAAGARFISYAGRGLAEHDDGTLAPMAPAAPALCARIVIPALVAIRERHPHTWGRYGFFDAFAQLHVHRRQAPAWPH